MGIQTIFAQVEGTYPDYRRVCQFTTDGTVANYNYEYLTQFLKVQHLLGGSKTATLNLYQNGNSSALVHLAGVDNFVGVVMPMRNDVTNQAGATVSIDFTSALI